VADTSAGLAIYMTVHSDEPLDDVIAAKIGRSMLGLSVQREPIRRNVLFPTDIQKVGIVGTPEEVIRAFHPPFGRMEGRGLDGSRPTQLPMRFRSTIRPDSTIIGGALRHGARVDVPSLIGLSPEDRLKHIYVIGKTGSGKTNLLKNLVRQDIERGDGVAVIDPHGGLVDYALKYVGDRLEDVVLLDFSDPSYLPVLNPLLVDSKSLEDWALAVEDILDITV